MRLSFIVQADFYDSEETSILPPSALNQKEVSNLKIADYLDFELADLGIIEGVVRIWVKDSQGGLKVVFWMPEEPAEDILEQLRDEVITQLDDGLGEGGFEIQLEDQTILVMADLDAAVEHELVDDGKKVPPPSPVAIAARDGDLSQLAQLLATGNDQIDELYQGYTALHLALLYGNFEAVKLLITHGADPNQTDLNNSTPLKSCALSNSLDEIQCFEIARLLLEAGADPGHIDDNGETAKSYAVLRNKSKMAELF